MLRLSLKSAFLACAVWLAGLAAPALAAPTTVNFGPYFLTHERLSPGLWRFLLSARRPGEPPWPAASSMLTDPKGWTSQGGPGAQARLTTTGTNGPKPILTIIETLPDGEEAEVFVIAPYAPDGQLAGLEFFGERYTNVVGLGADFRIAAANINHMGRVVMPGGPFGGMLARSELADRTTGIQVPVCFALGPGRQNGALFLNQTRPLTWDFTSQPWLAAPLGPLGPDDGLEFFVLLGPDLPSLRRTLMSLVGRPPAPPKTVFAPWVLDQAPAPAAVENYLKALALKKEGLTTLTAFWPDWTGPPPLAAAAAAGLNVLAAESPYLPQSSSQFPDMAKRGFLVRDGGPQGPPLTLNYQGQLSGLIDYTNPAAASYFHSLGRAGLISSGARLFYLTGGEPEVYSVRAWYQGVMEPQLHSHYAWGPRFSLSWMAGFLTGLNSQNLMFQKPRLFLLSRAGSAGLGRHGAGVFAPEPNVFSAAASGQARGHLSMSGVDYYSTDISGMLTNSPLAAFNQFYEAWFSKNALLNLPLIFPAAMLDEPWARLNLKIKAQWEPYVYSLAHQASLTGDPVTAPLFYHFQDDVQARESAFETMVGPYLLVAAGAIPGAEMLAFHLPAGRWFDLVGQEIIEQPEAGLRNLPCKLSGAHVSPMLLKAGAIVPTLLDPEAAEPSSLIYAFPAQEPTSFVWHEDAGLNPSPQNAEATKTVLKLEPAGNGGPTTLTIKARTGAFTGAQARRRFLIQFVGVGNVGVAYLDGHILNRLAQDSLTLAADSGWSTAGTGRLLFKTPLLDVSEDHAIVLD